MKVICIDIDGTLYTFEKWDISKLGRLIKGARGALEELKNDGWRIILHTARPLNTFRMIRDKLRDDRVPYDVLWDQPGKPFADIYIDDRSICFNGNWLETIRKINSFHHWDGKDFPRPEPGSEDERIINAQSINR